MEWRTRVSLRVESLANDTKPPPDERWCGHIPVGKENRVAEKGGGIHQMTGHSAPLIRETDQRRSFNIVFFGGKIEQTRFCILQRFSVFFGQ